MPRAAIYRVSGLWRRVLRVHLAGLSAPLLASRARHLGQGHRDPLSCSAGIPTGTRAALRRGLSLRARAGSLERRSCLRHGRLPFAERHHWRDGLKRLESLRKQGLDIRACMDYIMGMNNTAAAQPTTFCECGKGKAERARVCFDCLAVSFKPRAHVAIAIGEPGPRFYARRENGSSRRFATHSAASRWIMEEADKRREPLTDTPAITGA